MSNGGLRNSWGNSVQLGENCYWVETEPYLNVSQWISKSRSFSGPKSILSNGFYIVNKIGLKVIDMGNAIMVLQ